MAEECTVTDLPDGTSVHVVSEPGTRNDAGPTFVLLAGTWGNASVRGPMVSRIDPAIEVVHVTLPGQDDNWPPPAIDGMSIERFSEVVIQAINSVGIERFSIGGHSLGGMIAIHMLSLCPDRIASAVSLEGWSHFTVSQNAFGTDTDSTLSDSQRATLGEIRNNVLSRWPDDLRIGYSSMWRKWDGRDTLAATDIPVLELWGDRGREPVSRHTMQIPEKGNICAVFS